MTFEEKIDRLENISEKMEDNSTPLEELIKLYEEGMNLSNECKEIIKNAELKITEISKNDQNSE